MIGASSRDTVSSRRIRVGDSNAPSRAAFRLASATFNAVWSLLRCALSFSRSAFVSARRSALKRRTSFLADSLASSLALALIARASARRAARDFRLPNRPIRALPPRDLVDYRGAYAGIDGPTLTVSAGPTAVRHSGAPCGEAPRPGARRPLWRRAIGRWPP